MASRDDVRQPPPPAEPAFVAVPPLRVILTRNHAMSQPPEEREIGWPSHWRLPLIGETIVGPDGWGGIVWWITWSLDRGVVIVALR